MTQPLNNLQLAQVLSALSGNNVDALQPALTEEQILARAEHKKKVDEANAVLQSKIDAASHALVEGLDFSGVPDRPLLSFLRGGVNSLNYAHHQNRSFIEYCETKMADIGANGSMHNQDNGAMDSYSNSIEENYKNMNMIEALVGACSIIFEEAAHRIFVETEKPVTTTLDFDISESAYTAYKERRTQQFVAQRKAESTVTHEKNAMLRLTADTSHLDRIISKDAPEAA